MITVKYKRAQEETCSVIDKEGGGVYIAALPM